MATETAATGILTRDRAHPARPGAESVESEEDRKRSRRRLRNLMLAGGVTVSVALLAIVLRTRTRKTVSSERAPSHIDWRLSVFSNNTLDLRPSLVLSPGRRSRHDRV